MIPVSSQGQEPWLNRGQQKGPAEELSDLPGRVCLTEEETALISVSRWLPGPQPHSGVWILDKAIVYLGWESLSGGI